MIAMADPSLGLTLTSLTRQMASQLTGQRYRDADTGAWCDPHPPHVDGCTCQPGAQQRCTACWKAWQHHVAGSARPAT